MVSTVQSRPNHYEMLGLKPTASADEIREAFTRQMRSPLRMTDVAQIGIAYATLRDPDKRQEYDRSIGLPPVPDPQQSTIPVTYRPWTAFIASPATFPVKKRGGEAASPPEPHVTEPEPEATASSIAEALRELARPEPLRRPETGETLTTEPDVPDSLALQPDPEERAHDNKDWSIDWKYPLFAVGGVVLTVALLGAWAGMTAGSDAEAAQEKSLTVALPKARPHPTVAAPAAAAAEPVSAEPEWLDRASTSRPGHTRLRHRPSAWADRQITESPAAEGESAAGLDPLAPEPAAQAVAATMPLSGKVIARTIERIGYSCGEVASTAAAERAGPGVYTVTCSSGQTYQATPVRGRYRFRRSDAH